MESTPKVVVWITLMIMDFATLSVNFHPKTTWLLKMSPKKSEFPLLHIVKNIYNAHYVFLSMCNHRRTGPIRSGGWGSLARIFSLALAQKSSGFARRILGGGGGRGVPEDYLGVFFCSKIDICCSLPIPSPLRTPMCLMNYYHSESAVIKIFKTIGRVYNI